MTHAEREKLTSLIEPVVESLGYELVDLSFQREAAGWVLRLFIDFPPQGGNGHAAAPPTGEPRGVSLEDCTVVSREVSAVLDVEDPFDHPYTLEVSSPGLDRPLRKLRDFARFIGQRAKIRMATPVAGRRNFTGRLCGVEPDGGADGEGAAGAGPLIEIDCDGQIYRLAVRDMARANLEYSALPPQKPGRPRTPSE